MFYDTIPGKRGEKFSLKNVKITPTNHENIQMIFKIMECFKYMNYVCLFNHIAICLMSHFLSKINVVFILLQETRPSGDGCGLTILKSINTDNKIK